MASRVRSRTAPVCFLEESGETKVAGGNTPGRPTAGSTIILSRALCRFEFFPKPQGLSNSQALRAAHLLAESKAPFARSDSAITTGKAGHGIWWWDIDRVAELLGATWTYRAEKVAPESLLQPPGEKYRHIALNDGFEAQYWRDATLMQSSWRRRAFTPEQWTSFVRLNDTSETSESLQPPALVRLPLAISAASRVVRSEPKDVWVLAQKVGGITLSLSLLAAAALTGRALGYDGIADAESALSAELAPPVATATSQDERALEGNLARQFSELQNRPSVLGATAEIHQLLARHGASIAEFSIEKEMIQIEIQPGPDTSLKTIASEVEASPWFAGVDPEFDNATGLGRIAASICTPSADEDADKRCLRAGPVR